MVKETVSLKKVTLRVTIQKTRSKIGTILLTCLNVYN